MLKYTDLNGDERDKVQIALERFKAFEQRGGYYLAFSGGKDSQCIYHQAKMAGVKFEAHYNATTVDPPELVRFIKSNYPDVIIDKPDIPMVKLIPKMGFPPTRLIRYCCEHYKESKGQDRVVVTGVRWAESYNRRQNQGLVSISGKPKKTVKMAEIFGADYKINKSGGLILNNDSDPARKMVERCYWNRKTVVNPIIDWEEEDVWEFLNDVAKVPHCCLYDEGFTRLGCVGCPLGGSKSMKQELERWPAIKNLYLSAFDEMIKVRRSKGKGVDSWETAQDVMDWWIKDIDNQELIDEQEVY